MPKRKYIRGTVEARIAAYTVILSNGCWEWTGQLSKQGYAVIGVGQTMKYVHRLNHEIYRGPIPEGLDLDHQCHDPKTCLGGPTCPHRRCVNPWHTESVTKGINTGKGRSSRFESIRTVCKYGHELTPENTWRNKSGNRHCIECNIQRGKKPNQGNYELAPPRTACRRGHPFTPDNTYIRPNGTRLCRTCVRRSKNKVIVDV